MKSWYERFLRRSLRIVLALSVIWIAVACVDNKPSLAPDREQTSESSRTVIPNSIRLDPLVKPVTQRLPKLGFEDGTSMGLTGEYAVVGMVATTEMARTGLYSLSVDAGEMTLEKPANVRMPVLPDFAASSVLSAYILVPDGGPLNLRGAVFALDGAWNWIAGSSVSLQPSEWTYVELTLPPSINLPLNAIGLQVLGTSVPWTGKFYIDDFDWQSSNSLGKANAMETVSSAIKVDQVGYLPNLPKIAKLTRDATEFTVVASQSGTEVFRGVPELKTGFDAISGDMVLDLDFSALQKPGIYHIEIPGVGKSNDFAIGDRVYDQLWAAVLKGFHYQRCGLDIAGGSPWDHPASHLADALLWEDKTTRLETTGGWHDAGDYGKFSVTAAVAAGTILHAYDIFPVPAAPVSYDPKAGSLPPVLAEVKWELDWLLKMQDARGGVHHKLTSERWTGNYQPHLDSDQRYVFAVSSTATADFAAVMARAARTYMDWDPGFAAKALAAAEKSWQWLSENPTITPPHGFNNPPGVETGVYGDGDDTDERLWAAAELYRTTGEERFQQYFTARVTAPTIVAPAAWPLVSPLAMVAYLEARWPGKSAAVTEQIKADLVSFANQTADLVAKDSYNVALSKQEYHWGSNGVLLNRALLVLYANRYSPDQRYVQVSADQLHYVLGRNANGKSYVTGIGSNPVRYPFHQWSMTGKAGSPVPGLLSGGPNLSEGSQISVYPAKAYKDDTNAYYVNETAIDLNAVLLFALAGVMNAQ